MMTGIKRVVKAGFVGFWRSAYVSLASVFVLTVALFVIGATMFIDQLLSTSLTSLQSKVDINVYFVPDAAQDSIDRVTAAVKALPEVDYVKYTSREDALKEYRARNQNDEIAMQALDELNANPLGANLAIQAKETSQYEKIAAFNLLYQLPFRGNVGADGLLRQYMLAGAHRVHQNGMVDLDGHGDQDGIDIRILQEVAIVSADPRSADGPRNRLGALPRAAGDCRHAKTAGHFLENRPMQFVERQTRPDDSQTDRGASRRKLYHWSSGEVLSNRTSVDFCAGPRTRYAAAG